MKNSNGIVRINLGCGSKLLPYAEGWINVDIVDPPEVVLDTVAQVSGFPFDEKEVNDKTLQVFHAANITNMAFIKTGSVHEVHAYHVIEHFAPHELPALFKEIKRVLHPEMGCLVCEQPNVIKCAKNMLQVETTKEPQLWYNLGLLGFYGEPDPANPYMLHKWGWWPESLTDVLLRNGFKAIIQQDAKTHAGDVRDFRLVAFVDKVPQNITGKTEAGAASQLLSKQAVNSGIGLKNPQNGKHEPLVITPQDSVPSKNLLDNIQSNANMIKDWIGRSRVHGGKAFIVSAGPSLEKHAERLKKEYNKEKGDAIFCVKHSLPRLLEVGITPDFCVILDPRPLDGVSTHGFKRKELFKTLPSETVFLVASMTEKNVTKYLLDNGANVVGWHALANGIDKFQHLDLSVLISGGTSSCMRSINLSYNFGFREVVMIGFDSSMDASFVPTPEDLVASDERGRPKYIEVYYKDKEKKFYSTGELVAQAQDLIAVFSNPADILFDVWDSNYATEIWNDYKTRFKQVSDFSMDKFRSKK